MNKKILIIGLGIGSVYEEQSKILGYHTITVDTNKEKNATYLSIEEAIENEKHFDLSIICTPNYLHGMHAFQVAPYSDVILVEKPGFRNVEEYERLNKDCGNKILLVKNNLYRKTLSDLNHLFYSSANIKSININWLNNNRTPYPGGWFTNEKLSFGGVSYDLLPHLIHFMYAITGTNEVELKSHIKQQYWSFEDAMHTEYGSANHDKPVYNVDDYCKYEFLHNGIPIILQAAWKTDREDDRSIKINFNDGTSLNYEFGLCPNEMYGYMIADIMKQIGGVIFNQSYDKSMLELISLK